MHNNYDLLKGLKLKSYNKDTNSGVFIVGVMEIFYKIK